MLKEVMSTIYVPTMPAKNWPKPGGNVRDDITKATSPGYIKRLKCEQINNVMSEIWRN
jgi:hypothetical protein